MRVDRSLAVALVTALIALAMHGAGAGGEAIPAEPVNEAAKTPSLDQRTIDPEQKSEGDPGVGSLLPGGRGGTQRAVQVTAGTSHTCALFGEHNVTCWGSNKSGQSEPFEAQEPIRQIASGTTHTCALLDTMNVTCWGGNDAGQAENYTAGDAVQVAAGSSHTCILRTDEEVHCWGDSIPEITEDPPRDISQVAAFGSRACVLSTKGNVQCWDRDSRYDYGSYLGGDGMQLAIGASHSCVLRTDGSVHCWGESFEGQAADYLVVPVGTSPVVVCSSINDSIYYVYQEYFGAPGCIGNVPAVEITAGSTHTCARFENHEVHCWGSAEKSLFHAEYLQIDAGGTHTCGILAIGHVRCWGVGEGEQRPRFAYGTEHLAIGNDHACLVLENRNVECWGDNTWHQSEPYTGGQAVQVAVGDAHSCALLRNGNVECWGAGTENRDTDPHYGQAQAYTGSDAVQISAAGHYTCALTQGGNAHCWGVKFNDAPINGYRLVDVAGTGPEVECDTYSCIGNVPAAQVTTGSSIPCFLLDTGDVHCIKSPGGIGLVDSDHLSRGPYTGSDALQITAGRWMWCAQLTTGNVTCGGFPNQLYIPDQNPYSKGDAVQVAAAGEHTCALLAKGDVTCWGRWEHEWSNYTGGDAIQVTASADRNCALLTDGTVQCWGDDNSRYNLQTPTEANNTVGPPVSNSLLSIIPDTLLIVLGGLSALLLVLSAVLVRRKADTSARDTHPRPGRVFLGKYQVDSVLGQGAFGVVWLAEHTRLKRKVVVKQLSHQWAATEEARRRFQREAEILAGLDHPNVTRIYDVEEVAGNRFLVMEYVDGGSLGDRIQSAPLERRHHKTGGLLAETLAEPKATPRRGLETHEAVRILQDVLEGLAYIHEKGILHRDLKPANILVTQSGQAKIADFGVSHSDRHNTTALTQATTLPGTPIYMAPEQLTYGVGDERSDLYAAAATLYLALTGRTYFGDTPVSIVEIHRRILEEPPRLPIDGIPPAISDWLAKALAKEPSKRFQGAGEALQALQDAAGTRC